MDDEDPTVRPRTVVLAVLVGLILLVVASSGLAGMVTATQSDETIVNDDGTGDYETIQAAVDASDAGETIIVEDGIYEEEVTVTVNNISIVAADGATPILYGGGDDGVNTAFMLQNADDVTIDGFNVSNYQEDTAIVVNASANVTIVNTDVGIHPDQFVSGDVDGIHLIDSAGAVVEDTVVDGYGYGVYLEDSAGVALDNLTLVNNTERTFSSGVRVERSADVTVTDSTFTANSEGIRIRDGSDRGFVENNTFLENTGTGVNVFDSVDVEVWNNTVIESGSNVAVGISEAPGTVVSGNEIAEARGEPGLVVDRNSHDTVVTDNHVRDNGDEGILLADSHNLTVTNNVVEDNAQRFNGDNVGIHVRNGNHSTISGNEIRDNDIRGIFVNGETYYGDPGGPNADVVIEDNEITGHDIALDVVTTTNATIRRNDLSTGLAVDGDEFGHFDHTVEDNTVDGDPLFFAKGEDDPDVPDDAGQVFVLDSTNIDVSGHTFENVASAAMIAYSEGVTINDNTMRDGGYPEDRDRGQITIWEGEDLTVTQNSIVESNWTGLAFHSTAYAVIDDNVIDTPDQYGLLTEGSDGFEITDNEISGSLNRMGILIGEGSDNTTIENNVVTDNEELAGIRIESGNATVDGNTVTDNRRGISTLGAGEVVISNNEATDNHFYGIGSRSSSNPSEVLHIESNEVHRNGNGIGVGAPEESLMIRDNVLTENEGNGIDASAGLITNNTIENSEDNGISLSSDAVVDDNEITGSGEHGIYAEGGTVSNNTVEDNERDGIHLQGYEDDTVENNTVAGHDIDLRIDESKNAQVFDNEFQTGVYITEDWSADGDEHFNHEFADNTVDGDPLYYVLREDFLAIPDDAGQVVVVNSTGVQLDGLDLDGVATGVQLAYSEEVTITDTTISNTGSTTRIGSRLRTASIHVKFSENITIDGSSITDSEGSGLYAEEVAGLAVTDATVTDSGGHGLEVEVLDPANDSVIADSIISNNQVGIELSVSGDLDGISIIGNAIHDNENGLVIDDDAEDVEVSQNSFVGNDIGLVYDSFSPPDLNATHNWWGNETGPNSDPDSRWDDHVVDACTGALANGTGDMIDDDGDEAICFDPWLTELAPPSWPEDAELTTRPLGETSIELEWNRAHHDIGIESYVIDIDGLADDLTVSGEETSVVVDGLDSETSYTFSVYAEDASGQQTEALTGEEMTTGSGEIVPLQAEAVGGGVELEWEPALAEPDVTGYVVQHREPGGDWIDRQTLDDREANATVDRVLVANTDYEYRVLAVDNDDRRTEHTTNESITTTDGQIDQFGWSVDQPRIGYITPNGEFTLGIFGEPNWNATVQAAYTTWYDEDGTLLDEPRNATTRIDVAEVDRGLYRSQDFSVPDGTVSLTGLTVELVDGEGKTVAMEAETDLDLLVTGTLNMSVSSAEADENLRIEAWNDELQDGEIKEFDGDGFYTFESLIGMSQEALNDSEKGYDIRLRAGTGATTRTWDRVENVNVRSGLENPVEGDPVELAYNGSGNVSLTVEDADGNQLSVPLETYTEFGYLDRQETDDSEPITVYTSDTASRHADAGEVEILVRSPVPGSDSIERRVDLTQVEPGDEKSVTVTIPEPKRATLSGVVRDADGDPIPDMELESTVAGVQGYTLSDTTDENGEYEFTYEVHESVDLDVAISGTQRETTIQRQALSEELALNDNDASEDLTTVTEHRYQFAIGNFSYYTPGGEQQRFTSLGGSEATKFNFAVTDEDESTTSASRSNGGYPIEMWAQEGEEVDLTVDPHRIGLDRIEKTVTLSTDRLVTQDFEYSEDEVAGVIAGTLVLDDGSLWERSARDWAEIKVYDAEGNRVQTEYSSDADFELNVGESGTYELRVTAEHDGTEHIGIEEVTLDDASDSIDLGDVELFPGGRFGFQDGNAISASSTELSEGATSSIRVDYENTESDAVTDAELNLRLPEDVTFLEDSVRLDQDPAADGDVSVNGSDVTVDLGDIGGDERGTVRLQIEAETVTDPQDSDLTARIGFDDGNGPTEEFLGSVEFTLGDISIDVPETVEDREFTLQGRAPGESSLRIYADGESIATTDVGPNGYWSESVTLPDSEPPTWYRLQVEATKDGDRTSSSGYLVLYDPEEPRLEQVTMWQSDDPEDLDAVGLSGGRFLDATTTPITFSTTGGVTRFPRTMYAGLPFVFELDFNQPERVSDVEVTVDGPAGGVGEATYNEETGLWEAKLDNDQRKGVTWKAGKVYVDYETDTQRPPEITRGVSIGDDARELIDEPIDPENESWAVDEAVLIGESTDDGTTASIKTGTKELSSQGTDGLGTLMANDDPDAPGPAFELSDDTHIADGDMTAYMQIELSTGHEPVVSNTGTSYTGITGQTDSSTTSTSEANTRDSIFSHANVNVYQPRKNQLAVIVSGEIPLQEFIDEDPDSDVPPQWDENATLEVKGIADDNESATLTWTPAQDSLWVEEFHIYRVGEDDPVATVYGDTLEAEVDLEDGDNTFEVEAVNPHGVESDDGPTVTVEQGDSNVTMSTSEVAEFEQLSADLAEPEWQETLRTVSQEEGDSMVRATNRKLLKVAPGVDIITTGKSAWDLSGEMDELDRIESEWPDGCGSPPKDDIDSARQAAVADPAITASYTLAAGLAGTGVGTVGGAGLAAMTVAVDLSASSYKDQKFDDLEDALEEAKEEAIEEEDDCEEDDFEDGSGGGGGGGGGSGDGFGFGAPGSGDNPVADPKWKIDPSGFVYELNQNNTVENVTATVLRYNEEEGRWEEWDAESWGEENPQQTDAGGNYGWDVPPGDWRVVYEKDGYETTYSQDFYEDPIEVPPPHFEVNGPMRSLEAPSVTDVTIDENATTIDVEFDRYIRQATASSSTIQVRDENGSLVMGDLSFGDRAVNPHTDSDNETIAQTIRFEADESLAPGNYTVSVSSLVESYAEVPLEDAIEETVEVRADDADDTDDPDGSDDSGDDPTETDQDNTDLGSRSDGDNVGEAVRTVVQRPDIVTDSYTVAAVNATVGGDVDLKLEIESDEGPLASTPETSLPRGSTALGYLSIDSGEAGSSVEGAEIDFEVSTDKLAEIGADPEAISLLRYDESNQTWTDPGTEVVGETDDAVQFKTTADGFSEWAMVAQGSAIEISDTAIDAISTTVDGTVRIDVTVINVGEHGGDYTVDLSLDSEVVSSQEVYVEAGTTENVSFQQEFTEEGTVQIAANDELVGEITVEEASSEDESASGEAGSEDDTAEQDRDTGTSVDDTGGFNTLFGVVGALAVLLIVLVVRRWDTS